VLCRGWVLVLVAVSDMVIVCFRADVPPQSSKKLKRCFVDYIITIKPKFSKISTQRRLWSCLRFYPL